MEKNSTFKAQLQACAQKGSIPPRHLHILEQFYASYLSLVKSNDVDRLFIQLLHLMEEQCAHPFHFQPFHRQIRAPFDHYKFGLDLIAPMVNRDRSSVKGEAQLQTIASYIERGDNVIFFANHQTEADPQALSILLQHTQPRLAEELIFVAGERVLTDPFAAPISKGCNLLCIYSKRYIDHPPENKEHKQFHNKRTMQIMSELLCEGGKAIYMAPSGGRDRRNAQGVVEIAPFDPQSIEMFYLMAQRSAHPTHFFPMALKTYDLLPPPQTVQIELGEARIARQATLHLAIGPEIDMEQFQGHDKRKKRCARATAIHQLVSEEYALFP